MSLKISTTTKKSHGRVTGSKLNIWSKVGTFGRKWVQLVESGYIWLKVGTFARKWVHLVYTSLLKFYNLKSN